MLEARDDGCNHHSVGSGALPFASDGHTHTHGPLRSVFEPREGVFLGIKMTGVSKTPLLNCVVVAQFFALTAKV